MADTGPSTRAPGAHHMTELLCTYGLAAADLEAIGDDYSDEEADFYCDALVHASDMLLQTPAHDMAALACKLEIYLADCAYRFTGEWQHKILTVLIADARRLAGEA